MRRYAENETRWWGEQLPATRKRAVELGIDRPPWTVSA